jgi:hypothetical protein
MALNQNQFAQTPIQGMVDLQGFGSNVISVAVSANQVTPLVAGQAVKVENTAGGVPKVVALTADSELPAGFIGYNLKDQTYPADARAELAMPGSIMYMTAGAAINRWANVEFDVSENKVITAAGVNPICGFAFDSAAASGDLIRVYIGGSLVSGYSLPAAKFTTGTTTTTFAAGQLEGADYVVYTNTQGTPGSIATRTAAQMIAGIPNATVGQTYMLRVINGQGTGVLTMTGGTGVTITGTATLAINSWRDFVVTITGTAALTMQNVGTGTFS